MLVLNRKVGESIIMGKEGEIEIKVLGTEEREGKQVIRLGFEAPKSVQIDRSEVHHDKRKAALMLASSRGSGPGKPGSGPIDK